MTRLTAQIVSLSEAAPTQFAWPVFASLEILPNRISPFRVFDGETFEFKQQSCRSRLIFGRKREKRREEKYEPLSSSIDTNRFSALYVIITSNAAKEFRTLSWRSGNGGKKKEREAKRLEEDGDERMEAGWGKSKRHVARRSSRDYLSRGKGDPWALSLS